MIVKSSECEWQSAISGWRSAITCDGNRASVGGGRSVLAMLIE